MLARKHLHHILIILFMSWAVVFSAVAPSVSKILNASNSSVLLEICGIDDQSPRTLNLQFFKEDESAEDNHLQFDHCQYCMLQSHCPYLPIANLQLTKPLLPTNRIVSSGGGTSFFKHFPLEARLSRAPPLSSCLI